MCKDPNSPFNWHMRTGPSIFAQDLQFRARKDGKSNGMVQSESVQRRREAGEDPGTIKNLGAPSFAKDARLLAFKQFGTNVNSGVSIKKKNKHE